MRATSTRPRSPISRRPASTTTSARGGRRDRVYVAFDVDVLAPASSRLHARARRADVEEVEPILRDVAVASPLAGLGLRDSAADADPAALRRLAAAGARAVTARRGARV